MYVHSRRPAARACGRAEDGVNVVALTSACTATCSHPSRLRTQIAYRRHRVGTERVPRRARFRRRSTVCLNSCTWSRPHAELGVVRCRTTQAPMTKVSVCRIPSARFLSTSPSATSVAHERPVVGVESPLFCMLILSPGGSRTRLSSTERYLSYLCMMTIEHIAVF